MIKKGVLLAIIISSLVFVGGIAKASPSGSTFAVNNYKVILADEDNGTAQDDQGVTTDDQANDQDSQATTSDDQDQADQPADQQDDQSSDDDSY